MERNMSLAGNYCNKRRKKKNSSFMTWNHQGTVLWKTVIQLFSPDANTAFISAVHIINNLVDMLDGNNIDIHQRELTPISVR